MAREQLVEKLKLRGGQPAQFQDMLSVTVATTVQKRGAAIIAARGPRARPRRPRRLSATCATGFTAHPPARGPAWPFPARAYGVAEGIVYSFPVTTQGGKVRVVEGLENSAFIREKMRASEQELLEERQAVEHLL